MSSPQYQDAVPEADHPALVALAARGLKCHVNTHYRHGRRMTVFWAFNDGGIVYSGKSRTGAPMDALARLARQAGLEHVMAEDELPWPRGQPARRPYDQPGVSHRDARDRRRRDN